MIIYKNSTENIGFKSNQRCGQSSKGGKEKEEE